MRGEDHHTNLRLLKRLVTGSHASGAFRPRHLHATRNPNAQGWGIEIMTVVDILANGKVRVKLIADGHQTEAVAFPIATRTN